MSCKWLIIQLLPTIKHLIEDDTEDGTCKIMQRTKKTPKTDIKM